MRGVATSAHGSVVVVDRSEFRIAPTNGGGGSNDPVSMPSSAFDMNDFQIDAGNEPPVTDRPRTDFMNLGSAPGSPGYPIQTAAVSRGV